MVKASLLLSVAALAAVGSGAPHVRRGVGKHASKASDRELVTRKAKAYLDKRDRAHALHKRTLATRNVTEHLAPIIGAAKLIETSTDDNTGGAVSLSDGPPIPSLFVSRF